MPAPIIAAYDPFSEDRAPVELALAAATLTGADVIAVSVVATLVPGWADPYIVDAGLVEAAEAALRRLREDMHVVTRTVTDASVPRALHAVAGVERASMIVVGSTRRGTVGRVLPGSTAERLLHGAPCPVVLAPRAYTRAPLDSIAVGFVATPEGNMALAVAHRLAARSGARLRVITALRPSSALNASIGKSTPPPRGLTLEGRDRTTADGALSAALDTLPIGVEIEPELHVDDPADVLVAVSAHVGLVVCGSRGYGPLRSVLLGGVSRRLVDGAHCPVLVLPRAGGLPLDELMGESRAAVAVG